MELRTVEEQQIDSPLGAYASRNLAGAGTSSTEMPLKNEQGAGDRLRVNDEGVTHANAELDLNAQTTGKDREGGAASSSAQEEMLSGGKGRPGQEAGDKDVGQSSLAASERPTVVRIKRRRTESPLDALMLEVASRAESGQGLDDAIVMLALEERPTARKLFRRIDTVSEADLRAEGAGESLLQRLNGLRTAGTADAEGTIAGVSARRREEPSRVGSSEIEAQAEGKVIGDGQNLETATIQPPPSAPLFPASHAEKGPSAKRSPTKHSRKDAHGRSKEDALSQDLRSKRQQELMTSARKGRLEAASAARYEQVRGRRGAVDPMGELFRLYDVVRVDEEEEEWRRAEREARKQAVHEMSERRMLLMNYLPLLRETVPSAAADLQAPATWQDDSQAAEDDVSDGEGYVYDVFALEEGATDETDGADELHPVVRVADDLDMRPTDEAPSEYDSEDSNDENNPDNDYPEDEFDGAPDAVSDASSRDPDLDVYADDDEEYDVMAYDEEDSDEEGVRVGAAMSSWAMRR